MKYTGENTLQRVIQKIKAKIPTNNNQLTNGAGYQTASDVDTKIANAITTALNTEV